MTGQCLWPGCTKPAWTHAGRDRGFCLAVVAGCRHGYDEYLRVQPQLLTAKE